MTETRFNLIFKGEVESGHDQNETRYTLESLFEFEAENQPDFFSGQSIVLCENMNASTANSFKRALADAGIKTHLLADNDIDADQEIPSRRLAQRRKNTERRARFRSAAILPDRRRGVDRRR